MPLFKCSKCGAVENTSLGDYWKRLCSECETGKWHGRFLKRYTKDAVYYQDAYEFIYSEDEVDKNSNWTYNKNIKMIGRA